MSELIVEVSKVNAVKKHPNADRLDIVTIKGFDCVVGKDEFRAGDKVVYFPPETLFQKETAERLGVTKYLSWKEAGGRTKVVRLRGEYSFGIVIKPDNPRWAVGEDVASHYGVTKYEPPVRPSSGGDSGLESPHMPRYTAIENLRHFDRTFEATDSVVATYKYHGSNWRTSIFIDTYLKGNKVCTRTVFASGSHNVTRKIPAKKWWSDWSGVKQLWNELVHPNEESSIIRNTLERDYGKKAWQLVWDEKSCSTNPYWFAFSDPNIRSFLLHNQPSAINTIASKSFTIYGEVFGAGIQKGFDYGSPNQMKYVVFDAAADGTYRDIDWLIQACKFWSVPYAEVVYRGNFDLQVLTSLSNGPHPGTSHIREGIVVRPVRESEWSKGGVRPVLKLVGSEYLTLRDGDNSPVSDYSEE